MGSAGQYAWAAPTPKGFTRPHLVPCASRTSIMPRTKALFMKPPSAGCPARMKVMPGLRAAPRALTAEVGYESRCRKSETVFGWAAK